VRIRSESNSTPSVFRVEPASLSAAVRSRLQTTRSLNKSPIGTKVAKQRGVALLPETVRPPADRLIGDGCVSVCLRGPFARLTNKRCILGTSYHAACYAKEFSERAELRQGRRYEPISSRKLLANPRSSNRLAPLCLFHKSQGHRHDVSCIRAGGGNDRCPAVDRHTLRVDVPRPGSLFRSTRVQCLRNCAWLGDDFFHLDAGHGWRFRQLDGSVDDRGAGHGVPAYEQRLVLVAARSLCPASDLDVC